MKFVFPAMPGGTKLQELKETFNLLSQVCFCPGNCNLLLLVGRFYPPKPENADIPISSQALIPKTHSNGVNTLASGEGTWIIGGIAANP